jgi:hypothetical protein
MTHLVIAGFASLLIASVAGAYNQAPQKAVPATLLTSIDAQKSKAGDEVSAQISEAVKSDGRVVIPKGAKLTGHVVESKARTDDEGTSQIVLTFDKGVTEAGKEIPLTGSVASISRAQGTAAPSDAAASDMGVPSSAGGGASASPQQGHSAGSPSGPAASGAPNAGRNETATRGTGAFTLQQRAGRTIISSNSENVHLAKGTQLLMQLETTE